MKYLDKSLQLWPCYLMFGNILWCWEGWGSIGLKKLTFFKELTSCLQTYEIHGQREQNTPNQRQTKISHCPTETIYLQNHVEVTGWSQGCQVGVFYANSLKFGIFWIGWQYKSLVGTLGWNASKLFFLLPTTLQYAKFGKVGIKNANLATQNEVEGFCLNISYLPYCPYHHIYEAT